MNKLKLLCAASLFATGIVQAATPCNGFQIKVRNELPFDMLVDQIEFKNGTISPAKSQIAQIDRNTMQNFIIGNSVDNIPMTASMVFHTAGPDSKKLRFNFQLTNVGKTCEHVNLVLDGGGFLVEEKRMIGNINYVIK